jgi:hypothetical protein
MCVGKFVAHLALVRKESEVESVLDELKRYAMALCLFLCTFICISRPPFLCLGRDKKIAEATHNIVAYRLILPDGTIVLSLSLPLPLFLSLSSLVFRVFLNSPSVFVEK